MHATDCDILVIGSGIAGLSVALAADGARVVVVTPDTPGDDGASTLAQGGIAAAIGPGDSPASHAADTLAAGQYRNDTHAVDALVHAAPAAIDWLAAQGVAFDRDAAGALALGREAAHAHARIVHAGGDGSGARVMHALRDAIARAGHVTSVGGSEAIALIGDARRVHGAWLQRRDGARMAVTARHVVLATGGIGALYARTTNPSSACGDGIALALSVGARVRDLEFVQFHPTAFAVADAATTLPLLSEALRGAGATLIDRDGRRFMPAVHAQAELAPRDVVARAVFAQSLDGGAFLDLRGIDALAHRFPQADALARRLGIDPSTTPLPVTPAAHYHMGGVAVDEAGATTVPGLYAVGEVAGSGVHGANRLASNSLLEGVVAGRALGAMLARFPLGPAAPSTPAAPRLARDDAPPAAYAALRDAMWRHVGLVRDAGGLREAITALSTAAIAHADTRFARRAGVAIAIARAALARPRSLGAHWRRDDPASTAVRQATG